MVAAQHVHSLIYRRLATIPRWIPIHKLFYCKPWTLAVVLQYVFMDMESYNETRLSRDESWAKYLKEGAICSLMFYDGKVGYQADDCKLCA